MSASGIKPLSDYKVMKIPQYEETLTVEYRIKIYIVIDRMSEEKDCIIIELHFSLLYHSQFINEFFCHKR